MIWQTRHQKIFFSDILFLKGLSDYVSIHTKNGKVLTLQNMKDFEKMQPFYICFALLPAEKKKEGASLMGNGFSCGADQEYLDPLFQNRRF